MRHPAIQDAENRRAGKKERNVEKNASLLDAKARQELVAIY